jgi:predicted RNA-binding Zn ribbon-like protein
VEVVKGVKVLFTHDTELTLGAAAALVNTGRQDEERLPDPAALDAFLAGWQWKVDPAGPADLEAVLALRPRLARLWEVGEDEAADIVNGMLRDAQALPQLVRHDGFDYHLHATPWDAPLARRVQADIAMAFVDVVRTQQLDRLGVCAASACDDVIVDLSRNRSRRFCDTTCMNRTNVAAYRARVRSAAPPASAPPA